MCTLSYCHHQAGCMTHLPLFRRRSRNSGMSCMSLDVLMLNNSKLYWEIIFSKYMGCISLTPLHKYIWANTYGVTDWLWDGDEIIFVWVSQTVSPFPNIWHIPFNQRMELTLSMTNHPLSLTKFSFTAFIVNASRKLLQGILRSCNEIINTLYCKKYAHGLCFVVVCCGLYGLFYLCPWELLHWRQDNARVFLNTLGPRQNGRHFANGISNALYWMEILENGLKFHWNFFLRVRLTIFQHWFR